LRAKINYMSTTVSSVIYNHHKKKDGTYIVKIKLSHKRTRRYINTPHFVSQCQIDQDFGVTDFDISRMITETLIDYRKTISKLGNTLSALSCDELKNYLKDNGSNIDFIKFCDDHINRLKSDSRIGTANNHRVVRNSLIDYFGSDHVPVIEINSNMLLKYERYLRSERIMKRVNKTGKIFTIRKNGLSDNGLHNHMRDLRTLFNAACSFHNNEDLGFYQIEHKPFKKYKIGSPTLTKKRNITIGEVKKIRDCKTKPGSRAELAKELFMLSFYLCGMNAVDIYNCTMSNINNNRLNYNRSKTKGKRKDKAYVSIKIIKQARPLLYKYIANLPSRYTGYLGLDDALSEGMKQIRKITGIDDITFYYARHTFANTARNTCKISKDDVGLALNHIDREHQLIDIYLDKDWSIIDKVQKKVVRLLKPL
jgi:integrase